MQIAFLLVMAIRKIEKNPIYPITYKKIADLILLSFLYI